MVLTLILACKKGGSLNYHLGRRGPERRGGDRERRRGRRRACRATFTRSEVPRPSCSRDWTFLVALALSGAPLWCSSWNRRAWGLVGVPIKVSVQLGSIWEALAGEEEPGGREEQRTSGDGRRGVGKRQHSGGVPF